MNLWQILARARHLYPVSTAVVDGGRHISYRATGARVDALAGWLRARGVAPGDRVACLLPNSLPCFEAYFAAAGLGAILVPLNTRLHPDELAFILRDSGSRVLLADPSVRELTGQVQSAVKSIQIDPRFKQAEERGKQAFEQARESKVVQDIQETIVNGLTQLNTQLRKVVERIENEASRPASTPAAQDVPVDHEPPAATGETTRLDDSQ